MTADHAPRDSYLAERLADYLASTADFLALAEELRVADLDAAPPDGGWTPRMVVHHVADAEVNAYVRLCRLLAEPPGTVVQAYDEGAWATSLHYERPVAGSIAVLRAIRAASAELLATIGEADLARQGVHTESGPYALDDWLRIYTRHPREHIRQIHAALT